MPKSTEITSHINHSLDVKNASVIQSVASDLTLSVADPTAEKGPNIKQDIQEVQNVIARRQNLFHVIGSLLRAAWDVLPSLNLPVAEARKVKKSDPKLEESLDKMKLNFVVDQDCNDEVRQEKESEIIKNIKEEFRIAAKRGPKTKELMLQCLDKVQFTIFDPELSKNQERFL
ncbi:MAG: hypothetical protein V4694_05475 [Pseudomonadota bacterium]